MQFLLCFAAHVLFEPTLLRTLPRPRGSFWCFVFQCFWVLVDSGIGERRHSLARGTNSGILCSSVPGSFYLCHYTPQPPFLKFLPPNIFSGKYFKIFAKPSDDLCKVRNDPQKDFTIYPKLTFNSLYCTVLLPSNGNNHISHRRYICDPSCPLWHLPENFKIETNS